MSDNVPAPKHLPLGIRIAINIHRELDPLAGFDAEDHELLEECHRDMQRASVALQEAGEHIAVGLNAAMDEFVEAMNKVPAPLEPSPSS